MTVVAGCSSDSVTGSPAGPSTGGAEAHAGGATSTGGRGASGASGAGGGTSGSGGATSTGGSKATGGSNVGGRDSGAGGNLPESGVDAEAGGPQPALRATAVDFYETETQRVEQAVDLSQYDVSVLVYDSTGKKFSTNPPTKTGSGAFEVETLPAGDRYVRYSRLGDPPSYYVTTSNVLDLGTGHMGRPDLAKASAGTELVFNVSNMEAWQDNDSLELFSLGAGTFFDIADTRVGRPSVTDTSLTGLAYDYGLSSFGNLIDGSKGDRAHVIHLSTRTLPGGALYQITRDVFSMPFFTMTDGQSMSLSGAFTTAVDSTLDVDWKGSQFEAAMKGCDPSATPESRYFTGSAQPYPEDGPFTASPDVLTYYPQDSTDFAATFTFNNPFSPKWPLYASAGVQSAKPFALPGSSSPTTIRGTIEIRILAPGTVALAPLVGCVRNATVGGQNAASDIAGVGATPVITFDAPAAGTASGYEIIFRRLVNNGGFTQSSNVGRIVTAGTSVAVPPGIMTAGNAYAITIRSNIRGNVDMNRAPLKFAFPGGVAEFLTGIVRP